MSDEIFIEEMTDGEIADFMRRFNMAKKRRTKYRNVKTTVTVDGVPYVFDSKAEAERYHQLKMLQDAGEIRNLELQSEFVILDGCRVNGKYKRPRKYRADFTYYNTDGAWVIEDVKGKRTPIFNLKEQLMWLRYEDKFKSGEWYWFVNAV